MKIAALLTCFNRREKTLRCLSSLFNAQSIYNKEKDEKIEISVFLTDDNCTDGTSEAIVECFKDKDITIIKGNGNLYWNGGMRKAWLEALKFDTKWDYFLLLNDDVLLLDNLFNVLFLTKQYSLEKFNKEGLYSGITCSSKSHSTITYGGNVYTNKLLGKSKRLGPSTEPQLCDTTNANILLIHKSIVDVIGIFWEGFKHGAADYDYAMKARKCDIPVLITAEVCGECEYDHPSLLDSEQKILNMSFKERKNYFNHPVHSNKDQLKYIKRNLPLRYPFVALGRFMNLYTPRLYYWISNLRNNL